jgi:hypothetical protein
MLQFALEYLDRGWAVIPVSGKTPAVPWRAYQQRTPTLSEVRSWFADENGHNLAVITGRVSGLVVVDCDTAEDTSWWQPHFPTTPLAVLTGRGGTHFYYRYPDTEVRNRVGAFRRKIDVRGDGGLVVVPPSIHPDTGRAYEWSSSDRYALSEVPLFVPQWIPPASFSLPSGVTFGASVTIRNGLAYIRHIEAVSGNRGHNATFRAACKLRAAGLTADEALEALAAWNETNAKPPWTAKELAHKIEDAYRLD